MKLIRVLYSLIVFLALWSCEVVLDDFNLNSANQKVVIEGLVTDSSYHFVQVSKTVDFYNPSGIPYVLNATVELKDLSNNTSVVFDSLVAASGIYLPKQKFKGTPGHVYELNVTVDGITYSATQELVQIPNFKIDSVVLKPAVNDERNDPSLLALKADANGTVRYFNQATKQFEDEYKVGDLDEQEYGDINYLVNYVSQDTFPTRATDTAATQLYSMFFYAKDPQGFENYYKFEFFRFDQKWVSPGQVLVADDNLIQENLSGIQLPGYFVKGDQVTTLMFGISKVVFNYYQDLGTVIGNDGGMFSPPPGNPNSNFSNGALGVFNASPVRGMRITVNP